MMSKTLVISPTYNEALNIRQHIAKVLDASPNLEVLIVDDGSPDGTGTIVGELAKSNNRIKILNRTEKGGLGPAYVAGFKYALENGYSYVFEMDADGSHPYDVIPRMLLLVETDCVVIGSRYIYGGGVLNWPINRMLISSIGNLVARKSIKTNLRDITGGFRAIPVKFLEQISIENIESKGYAFQIDIIRRLVFNGIEIIEVPILFKERELGVSKMSRRIVFEALLKCLKWSFSKNM